MYLQQTMRGRVEYECGSDTTFTLLGIGTDENHRVRLVADGQSFIGDGENEFQAGEDAAKNCLLALTGLKTEKDVKECTGNTNRSIVFNKNNVNNTLQKNSLKRKLPEPVQPNTIDVVTGTINKKTKISTQKRNSLKSTMGRGSSLNHRGGHQNAGRNRINLGNSGKHYNNANNGGRGKINNLNKSVKQRLGLNNVGNGTNSMSPVHMHINPNFNPSPMKTNNNGFSNSPNNVNASNMLAENVPSQGPIVSQVKHNNYMMVAQQHQQQYHHDYNQQHHHDYNQHDYQNHQHQQNYHEPNVINDDHTQHTNNVHLNNYINESQHSFSNNQHQPNNSLDRHIPNNLMYNDSSNY